jgi:hypothetical protein
MVVQAVIIHFLWGNDLKASSTAEARVMKMKPEDTIEDWLLLKQSLVVTLYRHGRFRSCAAIASRTRHDRHVRGRRPNAAR